MVTRPSRMTTASRPQTWTMPRLRRWWLFMKFGRRRSRSARHGRAGSHRWRSCAPWSSEIVVRLLQVQALQVGNVTGDVGGQDLPLDTRNWLCFVKIDPVLGRSKVLSTDQVTAAVVLAPATALPSVLVSL